MNLSELVYELGELAIQSPRLESDYVRFVNRAMNVIQQRHNWGFMHSRLLVTIPAGQNSAAIGNTFKELAPEKSPVTYADQSGRPIPCLVTSRSVLDRTGDFVSFQPARLMQPIQFVFMEQNYSPTYTTTATASSGSRTITVANVDNIQAGQLITATFIPANTLVVSVSGSQVTIAKPTTASASGVNITVGGTVWTINLPSRMLTSTDAVFTLSCFQFFPELVLGSDRNVITDHALLGDALLNKAKAIAFFAENPTDPRGMACEQLYQSLYKSAMYADQRNKIAGRAVHM